MVNGQNWCYVKNAPIIKFWHDLLEANLVPAPLTPIIRKILSIPIGSADAERSFSTLFHIRTKRRNRLTSEHLQDYLRIRMNGPKKINEFSALKYAKLWHLKNNMLTDAPALASRPIQTNDDEDEVFNRKLLDRSNLF
jgi:hypothetical protein